MLIAEFDEQNEKIPLSGSRLWIEDLIKSFQPDIFFNPVCLWIWFPTIINRK